MRSQAHCWQVASCPKSINIPDELQSQGGELTRVNPKLIKCTNYLQTHISQGFLNGGYLQGFTITRRLLPVNVAQPKQCKQMIKPRDCPQWKLTHTIDKITRRLTESCDFKGVTSFSNPCCLITSQEKCQYSWLALHRYTETAFFFGWGWWDGKE